MSCENDDVADAAANSQVSVIHTEDDEIALNTGFPLDAVIAKGVNMGEIEQILFDNKIDVIFNPVLNSESAIIFTVPFDEILGSKFGNQEIKFVKKDGSSFTHQFNILQPLPTILTNDGFVPERPTIGTSVTVNGDWFFDVQSVTFDGESVSFTEISSSQLSFIVPEDAESGADVTIETVAGIIEVPKFMDIYLGYDVHLIADFDGNGFRPNNDWTSYGDIASFIYSDVDGTNGNYAESIWEGATANGYNGTQSPVGDAMLEGIPNADDPNKVGFAIDVNCDGLVGTIIDIYIVDGEVNWAYTYTIENEGWQTFEAIVSEFGYNYNAEDQDNGDANPAAINQIKVAINQGAGTANPSKVRFDNLRWNVYENAQDTGANLLLNGGLEVGDGDDFTNWGKWNGADRMTEETSDVHGGSRALMVVNAVDGNPWEAQFVSDAIETVVDATYTASVWIKGDPGTVRFSTNSAEEALYGGDYSVTSDWQQYTWEFTANDVSTNLALDMGASTATYLVDDIKITAN